jgi:hypothetical protein
MSTKQRSILKLIYFLSTICDLAPDKQELTLSSSSARYWCTMSLARRLSNSSQDAFDEFCRENQPLSRRPSFGGDGASVGSNAKRRHDPKRERGQEVLKKHRSLSTNSLLGNKKRPPKARKPESKAENDENLIQSPTPYWKVAKERGGLHSPPETRASKKQKTDGRKLDFDRSDSAKREGLMVFSPPNQSANAKREKMQIERKTKER